MRKYVADLKNTGANGVDRVPASVFKDAFTVLETEILHLANISLATSTFPRCLKVTKLLPNLKMGKDKLHPSSYRPISSLTMMAKILERCGFDQVDRHLATNNIICNEQHGGRQGHSTTTCLAEISEQLLKAKEENLVCAMTAIDLSAAYDLCSHSILNEQLRLAGMGPDTRLWITSFLSNRQQLVEIEGEWSLTKPSLNFGLCQGGRSSGTLFTIYTNSLPSAITTNLQNHQALPKDTNKNSELSKLTRRAPKKQQSKTSANQFIDDTTITTAAKTIAELQTITQNA